jgi:hypothetical protein
MIYIFFFKKKRKNNISFSILENDIVIVKTPQQKNGMLNI